MPDEDIREEYKRLANFLRNFDLNSVFGNLIFRKSHSTISLRMTILRDIPDLPDMDFDPNDASDDIALFLGGEITAKQMTEKS